eukprot:CAMPEP_0116874502 /NCGR_PEP_ID=MMETSP0463-20121206/5972_1 /TAXON_ID=181622 /ORGANISM="Strombidinopsis sp, Strain SopsisLIS2011" /LENGTH=40 /DNA_ID= /DNA_START= /DNA_END= /DNA_ORIENTATION=
MAFDDAGGFGRFQVLACFVMAVLRNGGHYIFYLFAYITFE